MRELLEQAMDHALVLPPGRARAVQVVQVAQAAARQGEERLIRQWVVDAQGPAVQARLLWCLVELAGGLSAPWRGGAGPVAAARPDADEGGLRDMIRRVESALAQVERWVPLDDAWLRRDDALSLVALAGGRLGMASTVAVLQGLLREETPVPLARLAVARLWLARHRGEATTRERWTSTLRLLSRVGDVHHKIELLRELARLAVSAGEPQRVLEMLTTGGGVELGELELAEAVGAALHDAGALDAAAELWAWLVDAAVEGPADSPRRVEAAVRVVELQDDCIGPVLAELSWSRLVQWVRGVALPPDSRSRGAWSVLVGAALRRPHWSAPLRAALRAQPLLPPAWAAVLGVLEVHAGHPERARSIAAALAESQEAWGEDVEPGALSALLSAQLGDGPVAIDQMWSVLGRCGGRRVVLAPPGAAGPGQELERHFVEHAVVHDRLESGLELARAVAPAPLRLSLLAWVAEQALAAGALPLGLGDELRELAGSLVSAEVLAPRDLRRLISVLVRGGGEVDAGRWLARVHEQCLQLPAPMAIRVCAGVLQGSILVDSPPVSEQARDMVRDVLGRLAGSLECSTSLVWLAEASMELAD